MTALYVLASEFRSAAEKLADMDLPDEVIEDTLEGMTGELETKATNVAMFIRNIEASAAAIKEAEAQMAARRKAIENRAARMKDYLLANLMVAGMQKVECPHFKLSVRDNPPCRGDLPAGTGAAGVHAPARAAAAVAGQDGNQGSAQDRP